MQWKTLFLINTSHFLWRIKMKKITLFIERYDDNQNHLWRGKWKKKKINEKNKIEMKNKSKWYNTITRLDPNHDPEALMKDWKQTLVTFDDHLFCYSFIIIIIIITWSDYKKIIIGHRYVKKLSILDQCRCRLISLDQTIIINKKKCTLDIFICIDLMNYRMKQKFRLD